MILRSAPVVTYKSRIKVYSYTGYKPVYSYNLYKSIQVIKVTNNLYTKSPVHGLSVSRCVKAGFNQIPD